MADIIIDGTADVPIWIQIRNRIIYLIRSDSWLKVIGYRRCAKLR